MARRPRKLLGVLAISLAVSLPLGGLAGTASADEHDPQESGHPLRVIAYVLHPLGVIVDTLVFRPAHWVVHHEPFQTLFGHED